MDEEDILTNRQLGFELKAANNMIRRKMEVIFAQQDSHELNGMQGPLLGYLYHKSRNGDVYQKDVEREFRIRRSTATVMLQSLEQKGYLIRVASTEDARLKRILLTEKAIEHHNMIEEQIRIFNRELEDGITEEEKRTFLTILDKMMQNLGMDGERVESSNVPCRNE
ncbi:MAG TPA: MarR family transcriptional regulator [Lachnospiraceae bacterium]|jgi:transcriptional regulator, MarR family|nr:MarR family transcriptional regulator [Lachnospiraceae bacterium]HCY08816.1 MarR family transcriptional regulator [Lachnospiraceae bacterium]